MKCVTFCYHRVLPEGAGGFIGDCHRIRGTAVSVPSFQRQMADVARFYAPVGLGDFVAVLEGRATLPHRACLITFDDGYRDFVEHAVPVLEQFSAPCVLFVTAEQTRKPQPLSPSTTSSSTPASPPKPKTAATTRSPLSRPPPRSTPRRRSPPLSPA